MIISRGLVIYFGIIRGVMVIVFFLFDFYSGLWVTLFVILFYRLYSNCGLGLR